MSDSGLTAMATPKAVRKSAKNQTAASQKAPLSRRERAKQDKLSRIIAASKQLFDEKGFLSTTTQEIAEKADIGTGTLFLYAKSKEDLLILVFHDEMNAMLRTAFQRAPANATVLDQLMRVFGLMVTYHSRDIELSKALIKQVTITSSEDRRDDVASLMRGIYRSLTDLIVSAQRTGTLRKNIDPLVAAQNFFAIYYLGLITWLGGHMTKQQFLNRLRTQLSAMIDGLSPHSAAQR